MPSNAYGSNSHRSTSGFSSVRPAGGARFLNASRTRTEDQQPNERAFGAVGRRAMAPPIIVPASIATSAPVASTSATNEGGSSSTNALSGPFSVVPRPPQQTNTKSVGKRRIQQQQQPLSSSNPSFSRPNPASSVPSSSAQSSPRYGPYPRKAVKVQPTSSPLHVRPKPKKRKSFQPQPQQQPLNPAASDLSSQHPLPGRPANLSSNFISESTPSLSAIPIASSDPNLSNSFASGSSSIPAASDRIPPQPPVHVEPPPIPSLTDDLVDLSLSASAPKDSVASTSSTILSLSRPSIAPSTFTKARSRQPSLPNLIPKLESASPSLGSLALLPTSLFPPDIKPSLRFLSPSPAPSSSANPPPPQTSGALRFSISQLPPSTMTTDKSLISMRKAARKAFVEEAVRTLGNESKRTSGGAKWRDDGVVLDWYLDEKSGTRWIRWPRKGMGKKDKEAFRVQCRKELEEEGSMEIVGVKDVPGDRGLDLKWKRTVQEPAEGSQAMVEVVVEIPREMDEIAASGEGSLLMTGIEVPAQPCPINNAVQHRPPALSPPSISTLSQIAKGKQPRRPSPLSSIDPATSQHIAIEQSNHSIPFNLPASLAPSSPAAALAPAPSAPVPSQDLPRQLSEEEEELLELEATERRAKELREKIAQRERLRTGLPVESNLASTSSTSISQSSFASTSSSFYPSLDVSSHLPSTLRRPSIDPHHSLQHPQQNVDVLVTRLPPDASELEVRRFLGVLIVVEYQRLSSHALVTFETERAALDAVRLLDGQDLRPGVSVSLTLARRRARTPAEVALGSTHAATATSSDRPDTDARSLSNFASSVPSGSNTNVTKRKHLSPSPPFCNTPTTSSHPQSFSDATNHVSSSFDPPQPTKKAKAATAASSRRTSAVPSSLLPIIASTSSPGSTTSTNAAASSSRVDSKLSMQISVLSRATTMGLEKKRKDKSRKVIVSVEKGMYVHASMNGVIRRFDRDKQTLMDEPSQVPLTSGSSVEDIIVSGRRIIVGSSVKTATKDQSSAAAKAHIFYLDLNGGTDSRGLLNPLNDLAHSKGVVSLATIPQTALDVEYASGVSSFASGGVDHAVRLWNIDDDDNHTVRNIHQTHTARVDALAFSEGKGWLMSGGADGRVVAYDLAAQRAAAWAIPKCSSAPVLHVHLSTDPNLVLIEIRSNNLQYRIWDVRTPSQAAAVITFGDPPTAVTTVGAKSTGEASRYERGSFLRPLFAKGSVEGVVKIWDMRNPSSVQQLPLHTTRIQQVLFDGPDRLLDVSADELYVRRYGLLPGKR